MLFRPASNDQAYLKAGFFGQQGSGKTYTASSVALGLHEYLKERGLPEGKNPVLFADTETGSSWVRPLFEKAGVPLEVAKTRAWKDLVPMIQEAQERKSILLIDSLTHFWNELLASYLKVKKRDRLVFSDWNYLKGPRGNAAFSEAFVNSSAHIIWCARAGFEYSFFENEAGQKELERTGVKAKAETEAGYEPSLVVLMSRDQEFTADDIQKTKVAHYATVLKDRNVNPKTSLDGKVIRNPTFRSFLPHIECLNLGGVQIGTTPDTSEDTIPPDHRGLKWEEKRAIVLEEIEMVLKKHYPSQKQEDKERRLSLMEELFNTRSWLKIQTYSLESLTAGRDDLWQILEGHPYGMEADTDVSAKTAAG